MKNKLIITLAIVMALVAMPVMMRATTAYANDENSSASVKMSAMGNAWHGFIGIFSHDDDDAKMSLRSSMNCPPGHWWAPGFLKNLLKPGHRVACSTSSDTTDPEISDLDVSNITDDSAVISWDTDERATTKVEYGTTSSYGSIVMMGKLSMSHEVMLEDLSDDTTYHYRVTSVDAAGNSASSSDDTFKTDSEDGDDETPPVISGISVSGITDDGATINWTTNEQATSRVSYGETSSYGENESVAGMSLSHHVTLSGLSDDTIYHYRITSRDSSNNTSVSSDGTFTTLSSDTTAPIISSVSFDDLTGTSVNINWHTNESADSKVYYGIVSPLVLGLSTNVSDSTMLQNHTVSLSSLTVGTTYYFVIKSTDAHGNASFSGELSFTTES